MNRVRSPAAVFCFVTIIFFFFSGPAAVVHARTPKTDPYEVRALNSIFQKWGIPSSKSVSNGWNITGDPCSGAAIDSTDIDKDTYNPGLKCDCSYDIGSTCHITKLKVYALDVVGVILDELWNLTFLTNVNLAQNYLSGPLPPSIGTLVNMQYLSVAANALSGELPEELGNLTDLISLSFGENNFTGPLPSELGGLTKLEQLYVFSSGVSGGIPPTFANLQNLRIVWASDTKLTGRIPDFLGNWSDLEHLSFQGNSFEGHIPNTFSNLTSVTDLRISDLSDGSSSLEFITNMKSLRRLDLSFNNLSGQIPNSLFNSSSLSYLFLGNNKLVGILPTQKSASLLNIDLSYNELSGTFPSWVNQPKLQLNLVFNNFTIESSNSSLLPSGLNCLQRGFPCNRGPPNYFNFSINCGGPQITDSNQIVYESNNETLGPATYHVNAVNRWAVSNVGLPIEMQNPQYTSFSSSLFTNTLDTKLFQTARNSAGSLRYYGLGLENGNYTVKLQFAEIAIKNPPTWKSLGKRIFDIFIQGNLVLKDFDIRKEAGGTSFGAVIKNYKVQVTENYLEIHLFWAGKGTCCIPEQGTYGPSISAITATPDFIPAVSNNPPINPTKKKNRTGLTVGIVVPVTVLSFLSVFVVYCFVQRRKGQDAYEDEEFLAMDVRPYTFSYAELRVATDDFNPTNKLGEGGFGPVYKGTLGDGRVVAVKLLSVASHQGNSQFVAEIATMSVVQHRNLVKLYGCCIEGDKRLIVYEHLENKSLDQALFVKRGLYLDWPTRYAICLGVARGLTYLHEESIQRIVHRDVKASNILLDSDLNPKISDFGLAKLFDDKKTHLSTRVAGTIGYLAPEYAMRGHLSDKVDVFGFGVVALEITSGRSISDSSLEEEKKYLLEWAWQLHEENRDVELVDSGLSEFNENEVKRLINIALLCTQTSPALRPSMPRVVAMLLGDIEVSTIASRPEYLTDFKLNNMTSFTGTQCITTRTDHSTP